MALQASGPISFSQIANEFGTPPGKNLGAYRISQTIGGLIDLPLDTDIPKSGTIQFGNFYSKRLNIVVYCSGNRVVARDLYNANQSTYVIGGFLPSRPDSSSGKKVWIHTNEQIGSNKNNRNNVALRTGSWNSDTELFTVIGSGGSLYGAGGDGGAGGGIPGNAGQGGQGSSALGVEYPTTIINQGVIFGGRGGGGGGAGGWGSAVKDVQDGCEGRVNESLRIGGGGGAGGRGLPAGNGGLANTQSRLDRSRGGIANFAGNGSSGTVNSNGFGGGGGSTSGGTGCNIHAFSGAGGNIESGGGGGNVSYGGEGSAGQRGYAIIISSSGSITSYTGNAASDDPVSGTVS